LQGFDKIALKYLGRVVLAAQKQRHTTILIFF
jgi:hypothetical protein